MRSLKNIQLFRDGIGVNTARFVHFLPLSGRRIRTKNLGFEYINCRPNANAYGTHSRSPLPLTEQYWGLTSFALGVWVYQRTGLVRGVSKFCLK
ncbi:MAG: hypothetical protein U7127_01605 [Phormidium sp.]